VEHPVVFRIFFVANIFPKSLIVTKGARICALTKVQQFVLNEFANMSEGDEDMSVVEKKTPGLVWLESQFRVNRPDMQNRAESVRKDKTGYEEMLMRVFGHMETLTVEDRRLKGELVERGVILNRVSVVTLPNGVREFLGVSGENAKDTPVTAVLHREDDGVTLGVNGKRVSCGLGDGAKVIVNAQVKGKDGWVSAQNNAGIENSIETVESSLGAMADSVKPSLDSGAGAA
jgi:hypothetical protein